MEAEKICGACEDVRQEFAKPSNWFSEGGRAPGREARAIPTTFDGNLPKPAHSVRLIKLSRKSLKLFPTSWRDPEAASSIAFVYISHCSSSISLQAPTTSSLRDHKTLRFKLAVQKRGSLCDGARMDFSNVL